MDSSVEGKLVAEREAGNRAKNLWNELQPYLDGVEARCMKAWREDAKTPELREEAWHRVKALDNIRAELKAAIEGGRLAESRLAKA